MDNFENRDSVDKIVDEYLNSKNEAVYKNLSKIKIFLCVFFLTVLAFTVILFYGDIDLMFFKSQSVQGSVATTKPVIKPGLEQRLNILISVSQSKEVSPEIYFLLGYTPDRGYITVSSFPHITYISENKNSNTLDDCYKSSGISYVAQSLGKLLNVDVQYHIELTYANIEAIITKIGTFDYEVVKPLNYSQSDRKISLNAGVQKIDARAIVDIMLYPRYEGAEQERSDLATLIATATLNNILLKYKNDNTIDLKALLFENSNTSLSALALERRKDSFAYLLEVDNKPVIPSFIEGELSRDYSKFVISESATARLQKIYSAK